MWHFLHFLLTPFELLLGLFCVLTAVLLYPGEDGRIQSKLEDFWIQLSDYQKLALSKHAAFMTGVAKLETRFLDRIFGPRLFSIQALTISCCFSLVVAFGVFIYISYLGLQLRPASPEDVQLFRRLSILCACLSVAFLAAVTTIASISTPHVRKRVIVFVFVAVCILFVSLAPRPIALYYLLAGFVCDALFVLTTRRLLRWMGATTSSVAVLGITGVSILIALAMVSPLYDLSLIGTIREAGVSAQGALHLFVWMVAASNLFDVVLALLFVLLLVSLLIHRALWPFLTRSVFRIQDIGTKGRRGILMAVGVALLGWSGVQLPDLVKELLKTLGS